MAFRLNKLFSANLITTNKNFVRYKSQRRSLGKSPHLASNLEQRLEVMYYKDPKVHFKVNIGFAVPNKGRAHVAEHIEMLKENRQNAELKELARDNKLIISLDEVEKEWEKTVAPVQIKSIAEHYAIYEHLFGDAYFYPVVPLSVNFPFKDAYAPVYRGNIIKPIKTMTPPEVSFESKSDSLWTLVLTCPDGHFKSENLEYVHWFVGNIPGNDIGKGEVVHSYIQALPLKGLGYLRYIFLLYKQDKKIDFSDIKTTKFSGDIDERSFSTLEFYKKHQDYLTPAGLSFFTSDWDESVMDFYHKTMKADCPEFVYDFPEHYYTKQTWFPLRQPFNLYLDRYRDQKQIAKERLLVKLKAVDPFSDPSKERKLKYPNVVPFKPGVPSWLKNEIRKERLGWARAADKD
ncbi:39S ribosomal protein L38, mitochondrial [Cimex lectularius]|uniref:Large ribosomal subunit protein mL38 n=1 Tax=Cimex lectularius TaxID=79782 RepID=A0A8I6RCU9_CIMLE|nr:39S ribosomal protein L38, mitochondrial [Cimex lectularius]